MQICLPPTQLAANHSLDARIIAAEALKAYTQTSEDYLTCARKQQCLAKWIREMKQ